MRTPARRALPLALSHMRMPLAHPYTPATARRPAPHHDAPRTARPQHTTALESGMRTAYHTDALVSLLGVPFLAIPVGNPKTNQPKTGPPYYALQNNAQKQPYYAPYFREFQRSKTAETASCYTTPRNRIGICHAHWLSHPEGGGAAEISPEIRLRSG